MYISVKSSVKFELFAYQFCTRVVLIFELIFSKLSVNPFNASRSKLLLFKQFSAILV